jgi:hypothetical protein
VIFTKMKRTSWIPNSGVFKYTNNNIYTRSEVLRMVNIKIIVFWMWQCSLADAGVNVSEKLLLPWRRMRQIPLKPRSSYHITRCHIAEDHNLKLCFHFQKKSWWNFQCTAWQKHEISVNLNSWIVHEVMLEINTSFVPHYSIFHTIPTVLILHL